VPLSFSSGDQGKKEEDAADAHGSESKQVSRELF